MHEWEMYMKRKEKTTLLSVIEEKPMIDLSFLLGKCTCSNKHVGQEQWLCIAMPVPCDEEENS